MGLKVSARLANWLNGWLDDKIDAFEFIRVLVDHVASCQLAKQLASLLDN